MVAEKTILKTKTEDYIMQKIPYAQFSFNGEIINLNKNQFDQGVRDGKICRCNNCLACRCNEYLTETREEQHKPIK